MKKTLYLLFISVLIVFVGCSKDDSKSVPEPQPEKDSPTSVVINSDDITMPDKGVISVQYASSPKGETIDKLVDGDASTKFSIEKKGVWIVWKSNSEFVLSEYSLTSADESSEYDPSSWTLSASNDSLLWRTLDVKVNERFATRNLKKDYELTSNDKSYKYYRLSISPHSGREKIQIADWGLVKKAVEKKSIRIAYGDISMPSIGTITVQYSDSPETEDVDKLVDNDLDTKFTAMYNKVWIQWKGDYAVVPAEYSITSAKDKPELDPKSWTFSASSNGIDWEILDEQNDVEFTDRSETKSYPIENENRYYYYKLDILENNGGERIQMADWTIIQVQNMDDLMQYSSGNTKSSQTPMGTHYQNRYVATQSDLDWLANPNNEPTTTEFPDWTWKEQPIVLYPFDDMPNPADLNQQGIGDCCALAVFASMAYLYPEYIKSIIKDNGDHTYTLTMYDPQGNAIDVGLSSKVLVDSNNKPAGMVSKNRTACWSTLFEKAIIKYNNIFNVNTQLGGIGSEHVTPMFTGDGESFAFSANKLSAEQLKRAVEVSLDQGRIVVGGFNASKPIGDTTTITGHAFTFVYSYDAAALFAMRNPWGGWGNAVDGLRSIYDDGIIPPLIDLRIIYPGKASEYKKELKPYTPPKFVSSRNVDFDPATRATGRNIQ